VPWYNPIKSTKTARDKTRVEKTYTRKLVPYTSSVTHDDNIPAIITDVVNDGWEHYKEHRKQHYTDCHDYYCRSHGSLHQNGTCYFSTTWCLIYGTYEHGWWDCTLAEAVYEKEKEFQSRSENDGNWKLPLSLLTTPLALRLPILPFQSLTLKKPRTALTCGLRKNGQSRMLLLPPKNHGVSKAKNKTAGTTRSRSYQMRKDPHSSLLQSPPDLNAMQLLGKLANPTKVIIPSYPPLILWDICQEWDLCSNNITQLMRRCHGVTTGRSKGTCTIQNVARIWNTCLRNT